MSSSNERLIQLAGQAVNWLHALASLHSRAPEIHQLADKLYDCVKGCPACGGPDPTCPCQRDE